MDRVRGRVLSFNKEEKYGYIRYSTTGVSRDLWFQTDAELDVGDTVEFEAVLGTGGVDQAADVRLLHKRVTVENAYDSIPRDAIHDSGVVHSFDPRTGVIWIDSRGHKIVSHLNDVVPNKIGRRVLPVGCPVEFERGCTQRGPRAFVIRDVSDTTAGIELSSYQEIGWLASWDAIHRYGFIVRPCESGSWETVGDELFCSYDELRTEGESDFPNGVWLRYKIGTRIKKGRPGTKHPDPRRVYFAREVECLVSAPEPEIAPEGSIEAHFLTVPELPVETPVALPEESRIYSASDRAKSLRQLIAEKKQAA